MNKISSKTPSILIFYLSEFEETCGKLEMNIPDKIYSCPFYIYDISLKKKELTFENEEEINEAETILGFEIIDKIWLDHVSQSSSLVIDMLFIKQDETDDEYSIEPVLGFVPGYDLSRAEETAKKLNFKVIRWNEYWN